MKTSICIVEICLAVLCLTALWGAAVAVQRERAFAWLLFFCLGYAILLVIRSRRGDELAWALLVSGLLNAAYLINRDWWSREGWIEAATPFYRALSWLHVPIRFVHPDTADGAMLALVPLQIAALRVRRAEGRTAWPWAANAAATVSLLLVGASKGTLLLLPSALLAGVVRLPRRFTVRAVVITVSVAACVAALAAASASRIADVERPWLKTSFDTARDFWLTGVGVGNFPAAFSLYRAVLPTAYLSHAQNLYLNVWLTHGIAGLAAFVGLCVAAIVIALRALQMEEGVDAIWRTSALGSLLILLVHGMYDDPYYDGGHLFLVFGLIVGAALRRASAATALCDATAAAGRRLLHTCALAATPLLFGALPHLYGAVSANLGALMQARTEIRALGDAPANDPARRAALVAAGAAESEYRRAIESDANNGLAHLRLGQIALLRRELQSARAHLQVAWRVHPDGRAERLLLGEVYWRLGDRVAAQELWRVVPYWEMSFEARRTQE
jgi:tetratricopeptide (TPR) repeat protein